MTAKVTYIGNMRTTAVHVRSESVIETDAPVDNHGKGERFSPTDLLATALATCILTTVAIAGEVHHYNIDGAYCDVTKIMASDPRRVAEIIVSITFPSAYNEKDRIKIEHIARTCPVGLSLHPDLKQNLIFNWPTE